MIFSIIFTNESNEEFKMSYEAYDSPSAIKWKTALKEQCDKDNEIHEKDRLYNFPDEQWTEEKLVTDLNECIDIINQNGDIINQNGDIITHRAFVGMPQEQLNHLHHYFEDLRGGVKSPTSFWVAANDDMKFALERYNIIIHRTENFYHNNSHVRFFPRIVCRFAKRVRYDLEDSDYPLFTLERKFGEIYVNYCEVGKPLYDVYKDDDDIVGEDNIRPLRYYSADFTVYFHSRDTESVDRFLNGMNEWWDQNHNYLGALGFFKDDPKNAIGNIPVAMLVDDGYTREELVIKLCEFNKMERVEIE
jgi:hypothetical protein